MSNRPASLKAFLEERHLTYRDNTVVLAEARQRIEQSGLLETMQDICAEINREAQRALVEARCYLPPMELVLSVAFVDGGTEYVMQIELWGHKPTLVFLTRKWRDTSSNRLVRWVYRFAQLEPVIVNVKFAAPIEVENLTKTGVEQWFFYLLSGLSHKFTPTEPVLRDLEHSASERSREMIDRTARATREKVDGTRQTMPHASSSWLRGISQNAEYSLDVRDQIPPNQ
jgi:hypothetical protein